MFVQLNQPPYNPDLTQTFEGPLACNEISWGDDELQAATETWFMDQTWTALKKVVLEVNRDYIEK